MKPLLLMFTLITIAGICNAQNTDKLKSYYADTAVFKIDTTINNVIIDGKVFLLTILRDKLDEHLIRFSDDDEPSFTESPMTIFISTIDNKKIVYNKKFAFDPDNYPYLNYSVYKGQSQQLGKNGKLYLTLNKSYGGSGSGDITYHIGFTNNKIIFSELFKSSGELSFILHHKNDNEIIVLDGIWNMKEAETHFSSHRYKIATYTFANNRFNKKELGQTRFKYASLDEAGTDAEILSEIKTKEPLLLKGISAADFR